MKKISALEYNSLLWFIMRAGYIGITLSNLISISKRDSWLSGLIAIVLGIIPVLVFIYLRNYDENKNIVELNEYVFGKFGKILNLLVAIASLFFIQMAFLDLVYFVNSQFLYKTEQLYISICFIIPIAYALFKGINAISKTSLILFYFVITTIVFIIAGVSGGVNIENLKPAFQTSTTSLIYGAIIIVAYNVLPILFLLIIPRNKIKKYKTKTSIIFYLLALLSLVNASFLTIAVFGLDLSLLYEYPEFHILKKVEIGDFIDRLESILALEWIVALFILIVAGLYFVTENLKITFSLKEKTNKIVIILVCLILVIVNQYIFISNAEANAFFKHWMLVVMFIFFLIIPIVTMIGTKLKKFKN